MASSPKRRGESLRDRRASPSRDAVSLASSQCCAVLQKQLAQASPRESWRDPIATFVAACRSVNAPPERMLTVFKRGLTRLPALRSVAIADGRSAIVDSLVQAAIQAYYE